MIRIKALEIGLQQNDLRRNRGNGRFRRFLASRITKLGKKDDQAIQ
jgi:hypothetical protein